MVNKKSLEHAYKQNLEESIISYLASLKNIELRKAMDIYYKSKLSGQIEAGMFGIENLDYKYLAQDLIENEHNLFT